MPFFLDTCNRFLRANKSSNDRPVRAVRALLRNLCPSVSSSKYGDRPTTIVFRVQAHRQVSHILHCITQTAAVHYLLEQFVLCASRSSYSSTNSHHTSPEWVWHNHLWLVRIVEGHRYAVCRCAVRKSDLLHST